MSISFEYRIVIAKGVSLKWYWCTTWNCHMFNLELNTAKLSFQKHKETTGFNNCIECVDRNHETSKLQEFPDRQ